MRRLGGKHPFHEVSLYTLADAFASVVEVEGPISTETAKRRVAEAWQTRIGSRISSHLDDAIRLAEQQKKLVIKKSFLWPVGMSKVLLRIPVNRKDTRPIREIPPEEIVLAIQECVMGAVGIEQEDLIREVCRLFGLKATDDNFFVVHHYVNYLVTNNYLLSKNGKITRGSVSS